jgi:thiol:disulfide interchange protein
VVRIVLGVAIVVFAIWLVFTLIGAVFSGLIHLLWIIILIALAVWVWQRFVVRRRTHARRTRAW